MGRSRRSGQRERAAIGEIAAAGAPPRGASRSARWIGVAAAALVVALGLAAWQRPGARRSDATRAVAATIVDTRTRILLIGVDGLDPVLLDMLGGQLPVLTRLREAGAHGTLRSQQPLLSPLVWTTIATGRPPDEHRVLDFLYVDPATGGIFPASSRQRAVGALWNIFSEYGRTSTVVGWFATWPAEEIRGTVVSDQVAYHLFQDVRAPESEEAPRISPSSRAGRVRELVVSADRVSCAEVERFVHVGSDACEAARQPGRAADGAGRPSPLSELRSALATTRSYHAIALDLIREAPSDFTAVYYELPDTVSHLFMAYSPPRRADVAAVDAERYGDAVVEAYRTIDRLIGELVEAAGPETTVVVVSDHGFASGNRRPRLVSSDLLEKGAAWHTDEGVLLMRGPAIARGTVEGATVLDVAPTLAYLSGFPVAGGWRGRPLLAAIDERFKARHPVATVPTYETPDARWRAPRPPLPADRSLADRQQERLRALGYVAPDATATPSSIELTTINNLGLVHLGRRELDQAEAEFRRAIALRPDYVDALRNLALAVGETKGKAEAFDAALSILTSAEAEADDVEFVLAFGRTAAPGELEPRVSALADAGFPAALEARGLLFERAGRTGAALETYARALDRHPASPTALARTLDLLAAAGDDRRALERLTRALERGPLDSRLLVQRGRLELRLGMPGQAEATFMRALVAAPVEFEPMLGLGLSQVGRGDLVAALATFERLAARFPSSADALLNLGATLGKLGRFDDALAALERARAGGGASAELLNAEVAAHLGRGNMASARARLDDSLRQFPAQPGLEHLIRLRRSLSASASAGSR